VGRVWIAALGFVVAACGPPQHGEYMPRVQPPEPATEEPLPEQSPAEEPLDDVKEPHPEFALEVLTVADSIEGGYERNAWKHWVDEDSDCQDTRQEVLIEESEIDVTFKSDKMCKVATGQWTCPYTGEVFTDPSKLDIGHMVPLKTAHEAGGHEWDRATKRRFANDLQFDEHLIAVSASANRSKGAKGPEEWMPAENRCQYSDDWISVKNRWELTVSDAEVIMAATQSASKSPPRRRSETP